jgi:hypothetical protein
LPLLLLLPLLPLLALLPLLSLCLPCASFLANTPLRTLPCELSLADPPLYAHFSFTPIVHASRARLPYPALASLVCLHFTPALHLLPCTLLALASLSVPSAPYARQPYRFTSRISPLSQTSSGTQGSCDPTAKPH